MSAEIRERIKVSDLHFLLRDLAGIADNPCVGRQERFYAAHMEIMRQNPRFFHSASMSDVWLQFRLGLMTVVIIGSLFFFSVALRGAVDGNTVGLALVELCYTDDGNIPAVHQARNPDWSNADGLREHPHF